MFGTSNFGTEVTSAPNVNFGTKSKTKFGSRPYSSQEINFGTKFEFFFANLIAIENSSLHLKEKSVIIATLYAAS